MRGGKEVLCGTVGMKTREICISSCIGSKAVSALVWYSQQPRNISGMHRANIN